jgi:hypothetical protein
LNNLALKGLSIPFYLLFVFTAFATIRSIYIGEAKGFTLLIKMIPHPNLALTTPELVLWNNFGVGIQLIVICLPFFIAQAIWNKSIEQKDRNVSFIWWKFQAYTGFLYCVFVLVLAFIISPSKYNFYNTSFITLSISILLGCAAYCWSIVKYNRWAFIIGTLITWNPFIWMINFFYMKNRWNEARLLGAQDQAKQPV